MMLCNGLSCRKPALLRCPHCIRLGLREQASYFCSKICFSVSWSVHKAIHSSHVKENLASPPFSIIYKDKIVPLRAVTMREDGKLAVMLIYSDHLGVEQLRPWASAFGASEDPLVLSKFWYDGINFGNCSIPITKDETKQLCNAHEFAFNVLTFKEVFRAMLKCEMLEMSGKKIDNFTPIVSIKNLDRWTKLENPHARFTSEDNDELNEWVLC